MRLLRFPLVFICLMAACDTSPQKNYVTTRDSLVAAKKASKAVGESCEQHDASECLTGLCLAVATARSPRAHICTQACQQDGDCPSLFRCGEVAPRTFACLPEPTWVESAATPRSPVPLPAWATDRLSDAGHDSLAVDGGN